MRKIFFISLILVVMFGLVLISCDTTDSPTAGSGIKDTVYVYSYDTTHSVDTVYSKDSVFFYDSVQLSYDTLIIRDTVALTLDSSIHFNGTYDPVPVDTNVFYAPGTDTGLVLSWWKLHSDGDNNYYNIKGVVFNNTDDTLSNTKIVLSFYLPDDSHIFTAKIKLYTPNNINSFTKWDKIPPHWWGEFNQVVKEVDSTDIISTSSCVTYSSRYSGSYTYINTDCKYNGFTYPELIIRGDAKVVVSYETY